MGAFFWDIKLWHVGAREFLDQMISDSIESYITSPRSLFYKDSRIDILTISADLSPK